MLEIKVTVEAPALVAAFDKLAAAIAGAKLPVEAPPLVDVPKPQEAAPAPAPAPTPAPAPSVPVASAPQYTVDQIMNAGGMLMDAGKAQELINLLHTFGVQAVMDLKPDQLGAFATEMRKLGAKI